VRVSQFAASPDCLTATCGSPSLSVAEKLGTDVPDVNAVRGMSKVSDGREQVSDGELPVKLGVKPRVGDVDLPR
jgi:hypothetical protein